jgi:hypothetical protein
MAVLTIVARTPARRRVRGAVRIWSAVCTLVLLGGLDLSAQTAASPEYQIKAVFLFNFVQFVEWPRPAFAGANTPLVIGVLGEDPFGTYLDETVRNETVNNRPLEVHRYRQIDEITTCHILFISRSETNRLAQILAGLKDRSILIVGDGDDFVRRGGMIRLATAQNKIRLSINVEAAKAVGLTLSSRLLRSAELVASPKD